MQVTHAPLAADLAPASASRRPPVALSRAVRGYALAVAALAALTAVGWWAAAPPRPESSWALLPLFAAATAAALLFPLPLTAGRKLTVAAAPDFATLLLFGAPLAILSVGVGTLAANVALTRLGKRNGWNTLFNTGQKMLTVGLAGAVQLAVLGQSSAPTGWGTPRAVAALALVAATAYLVNSGAVSGVIAMQRRCSPVGVWLSGARSDLFAEGTLYLVGALAAAAVRATPWAAPALIAPLVVVHQALVQAARETTEAQTTAARETDRLKDELLSAVSHELRTPLGAIKGYVSSLRHYGDRLDAGARADSLRAIDEAADRLTELVNDLLDLQRLKAGRLAIGREAVDLAPIIADVIAAVEPSAAGRRVELAAAPSLPPVLGDPRRLRQIVQNLLDNALKYSANGSRVVVRLATRRGNVELRVEDEGIGIPADQLTRVFDRFHRVDNSLTRAIGGTGIGLAVVRELVEAHGGRVWAESAGPGHGSTFVVSLPASDTPVASGAAGGSERSA